jgi:hypothetical protein
MLHRLALAQIARQGMAAFLLEKGPAGRCDDFFGGLDLYPFQLRFLPYVQFSPRMLPKLLIALHYDLDSFDPRLDVRALRSLLR